MESEDLDRIIEMAWEDPTSFEAIAYQFNLSEQDVISLMRKNMKSSSFKMWRERVRGRKIKHLNRSPETKSRFKSKNHHWIKRKSDLNSSNQDYLDPKRSLSMSRNTDCLLDIISEQSVFVSNANTT